MAVRKTPAIAAILGLLALTLVGCSAAGSGCERPSGADAESAALVTVTGSTDSVPKIDAYSPLHTDELSFWDVVTGEGTPITTSDQLVVLDVALVDAKTGKPITATPYDGDLSRAFALSRWESSFPAFGEALQCATPGTRVAMILPPGSISADITSNLGLGAKDSAVAVVDVRKVYLAKADGQNQYISGGGMPTVVRAPNGRPGIIIPDSAPPADLVVQVLKKGDGEVVTGDKPVRVAYTGVSWSTRSVTDTTWDGEPASVELKTGPSGFDKALTGQTVGSQVLVSVPPEVSSDGATSKGSTTVYVIDILGIDAPAPAQQ